MFRVLPATLVALLAFASTALAAPRTDCHAQATRDLQRLSPQGHAIYQAMANKKMFYTWVTCQNVQLGLTTAVHESVHVLTEERDGYPLIGGGLIRRQHDLSKFYAPREIAVRFEKGDVYVQTYLRPGAASSASDFVYLLDELNAYSHDLNSAVKLAPLHKGDGEVAHRDGLSALMSFVMGYVDGAKQHYPATWQGLQRPETKQLMQTLWTQAETALASSCSMPRFGLKDRQYIGFLCARKNSDALGQLLGRVPSCPSQCLPGGTASLP